VYYFHHFDFTFQSWTFGVPGLVLTTLSLYPGMRQALNMLTCIPSCWLTDYN